MRLFGWFDGASPEKVFLSKNPKYDSRELFEGSAGDALGGYSRVTARARLRYGGRHRP